MNYNIKINEVNRESSSVKAYATVVFGDSLVVRNIAIVEKRDGSNLRGFASIYLEDSFVIGSVSIVNGRNGEFVSMPAYKSSTKARGGESSFREIAYPITKEFREQLFGEILNVYHEKKAEIIKEAEERKDNTPFR